jgi:polyphosphate kinase 2 (PPK2 family)
MVLFNRSWYNRESKLTARFRSASAAIEHRDQVEGGDEADGFSCLV